MSEEFPEWAGYRLIMAVPTVPEVAGRVAVMLMCSCTRCTVLEFDPAAVGETGRSYVCGCGTEHWFRPPPPPPPEEG